MKQDPNTQEAGPQPGRAGSNGVAVAIASIRAERRMTLMDLSRQSSVAASTISRIESGHTSPTIAVLTKIADGLGVSVSVLIEGQGPRFAPGCRTIIRAGDGPWHKNARGSYRWLAAEISKKGMAPALLRPPTSLSMFSGHAGEEFFMVINGSVEFHMQYYAPMLMETGDSVYFDATTPHAVVSVGGHEATILSIVSLAGQNHSENDLILG